MPPRGLFSSLQTMLIILILNIGLANGNLLGMFRTACPYAHFCTVNSSTEFIPSSSYEPCCLDCFCDTECMLFDDCCPDFQKDPQTDTEAVIPLPCTPLIVENQYYINSSSGGFHQLRNYRVIDSCPVDNHTEKCAGNVDLVPDFDGMVVVSDRKIGTPYKNKYCAQCHGVTDVVKWDLAVLGCRETLSEVQLLASNVNTHLSENCLITSVPTDGVPMNSRSTNCQYRTGCSENDADKDIVDGCTNGPNMPYREVVQDIGINRLYKNVLCYRCKSGLEVVDDCPRVDHTTRKSGQLSSLSFLLNTFETPGDSKHACGETESFDPSTGQCRRVFCPPLEALYNGKCVTIASVVDGVGVKLLYKPVNDVVIDRRTGMTTMYNRSIAYQYKVSVNRAIGNRHCRLNKFTVDVMFDKDTHMLAYLLVNIIYAIDGKCSLQYIRRMIQENSSLREKWLMNGGKHVETKGKVTFFHFNPLTFAEDRGFLFSTLIEESSQNWYRSVPRKFFLCPYYVLELAEYNQLVTQFGKGRLNDTILTFTEVTETLNGYYQLSENEIAVCVQSPTNSVSSDGTRRNASYMFQTILCILSLIEMAEHMLF